MKRDINEVFALMSKFYEENMPFNRLLGFKIEEMSLERVAVTMGMKEDLIGNPGLKILHGGAISAILDFTGGVAAQVHVVKSMLDVPEDELVKKLIGMGTIDLRIDYIRPGRGELFRATGEILRLGKKVAVTRSKLHNDKGKLIAAGTSSYIL